MTPGGDNLNGCLYKTHLTNGMALIQWTYAEKTVVSFNRTKEI